jgi:F0F1-type ATP synthase epsilon subunit
MDNKGQEKFSLFVESRDGVLYDGEVFSLTSINEEGRFDILPHHANFISLISSILVIGELDGSKKEIKIDNGLLKTKEDKVEVYVGVEGINPVNMPASFNKI